MFYVRDEVGPILLDNVQCSGTESRLIDCQADHNHNCQPVVDAGAICYGAASKSPNYATNVA